MKYIQLILAFLGTIFLIGLPYMLAFWGYTFLAGIFEILPKLTFWNFLWVILAAEVIQIILNHSKDKNKNSGTTSN